MRPLLLVCPSFTLPHSAQALEFDAPSELQPALERLQADRRAIERAHALAGTPDRRARRRGGGGHALLAHAPLRAGAALPVIPPGRAAARGDDRLPGRARRAGRERGRGRGAGLGPGGGYGPLYQCAYLVGGVQLEARHGELVESSHKGERAPQDTLPRNKSAPVETIRATLLPEAGWAPGAPPSWRF